LISIERGLIMAAPENHTLRLLREIRSQGDGLRKDIDKLGSRMDQSFAEIRERMEDLARLAIGEGVVGRYAAADVDERLAKLEKRMSVLEKRR
jgi:hypothetical protein